MDRTDAGLKQRVKPSLAHTAQVEHNKEGASGYTWSYTAEMILPQTKDVQCHT